MLFHSAMNLGFCLLYRFWYSILFQVNLVNKQLQSEAVDPPLATSAMERTYEWLRKCGNDGFQSGLADAKETGGEAEIEPNFKEIRVKEKQNSFPIRFRKSLFNLQKSTFKSVVSMLSLAKLYHPWLHVLTAEETPWIVWFYLLSPTSHQIRFEKTSCSTGKRVSLPMVIQTLMVIYFLRRWTLKKFLPPDNFWTFENSWFHVWQEKLSWNSKLWTALKILLTIPATVALREGSFSKSKLIKNYLRLIMWAYKRFCIYQVT